jgi:hypothetical protein
MTLCGAYNSLLSSRFVEIAKTLGQAVAASGHARASVRVLRALIAFLLGAEKKCERNDRNVEIELDDRRSRRHCDMRMDVDRGWVRPRLATGTAVLSPCGWSVT